MNSEFDDDELRDAYAPLLRQTTTTKRQDCPAPEALMAALRGEGPEAERLRVLDHALRCPACRPELALLRTVSAGGTAETGRRFRPGTWARAVIPLAAAAVAVLAVGVWFGQRRPVDVTRANGGGELALVEPAPGSALGDGPVTFVWRAVEGAIRYTLEVDAPDGTVVYSTETTDTTAGAALTATGELRWWVRAHLDDGSERRSEARVIRLR